MVIIPQLIKQDTWFAIRVFHYRQITAKLPPNHFLSFSKVSDILFLIKFPNNFIRISVFICNFAAKFKTHINFKQTCCKSYSVLTLLKTN